MERQYNTLSISVMPTVFLTSSPPFPGVWVTLSCVCVGGARVHACTSGRVFITSLAFFLTPIPEYVKVSDGHPHTPVTQALKLNIGPTSLSVSQNLPQPNPPSVFPR